MQGARSARRVPRGGSTEVKRKPKAGTPLPEDGVSAAVDALLSACAASEPKLGTVGSPIVAAVAALANAMRHIIDHDDAVPAGPMIAQAHKYLNGHDCYRLVTDDDLRELEKWQHLVGGYPVLPEDIRAVEGRAVGDRVAIPPFKTALTRREMVRLLVRRIDAALKSARARGENALSPATKSALVWIIGVELSLRGPQSQLPGETGEDFDRKIEGAIEEGADAEGILRAALVGCGLPYKQAYNIVQAAMARSD